MGTKYVELAKRENNNKRGFLIVNPSFGKHVPISPTNVFDMFNKVVNIKIENFNAEETLVIGFAETATALSLYFACYHDTFYIQTTREKIDETCESLYFLESHSHAPSQYIVKDAIDKVVDKVNKIIFIDDEITTGNTILNAIDVLNQTYGNRFEYDIVSVLNSMSSELQTDFKKKNIGVYALEFIDCSSFSSDVEKYSDNGQYSESYFDKFSLNYEFGETDENVFDTRYGIKGREYYNDVKEGITSVSELNLSGRVLVIGTEEFMYIPLMAAKVIEEYSKNVTEVKFQATTRSPIMVSKDEGYPLNKRHKFHSLYDNERINYLYNLDSYDYVFICVEKKYFDEKNSVGLKNLLSILDTEKVMLIKF